MRRWRVVGGWVVVCCSLLGAAVWCNLPSSGLEEMAPGLVPTQRQYLTGHVSPAIAAAPTVGRLPPETRLGVEVGLPARDRSALQAAVQSVSDPKSPNFHHFLTKEQFGEQYGASAADYQALVEWAHVNNFQVTPHANRLIVSLAATAHEVEAAFDIHLNYATRPDGTRFRAPDREPSLALNIPVLHVSGLDDYVVPKDMTFPTVSSGGVPAQDSPPPHLPPYWIGATDIRNAYLGTSPTLTGAGQTICVVGGTVTCILPSDVAAYTSYYGLTWSTSQLTISDGDAGVGRGGTCPALVGDGGVVDGSVAPDASPVTGVYPLPGGETTLDVEMAVTMAPGAKIFLWEGGDGRNPLSWEQAVADNGCRQVTQSQSGGSIDPNQQNLYAEFALQGQSLFHSSGDDGAWTSTNPPQVEFVQAATAVGGTVLIMDGGHVSGEYGWPGSGGGFVLDASIPWYQLPAVGAALSEGGAGLQARNGPDISAVASTVDHMVTEWEGVGTAAHGVLVHDPGPGTSFSAPIWGGFMALVNEKIASTLAVDAGPGMGFVNPALYSIGSSRDAAAPIYDIVGNTNETTDWAHHGCDLPDTGIPDGSGSHGTGPFADYLTLRSLRRGRIGSGRRASA
jgi:subtilase family serine protease